LINKVFAFVHTAIVSRIYTDEVHLLDTFNAANNLPDMLFALISGGALAMAFIPLLTEYLTTKDRAAAWDLFSRVANFGFVVTGLPRSSSPSSRSKSWMQRSALRRASTMEQRTLLAELMRLNLIATLIFSISGLGDGIASGEPAFCDARHCAQHVQHRADLRRDFSRADLWDLWSGVRRHHRRGLHLLVQIPMLFKFGFRWTPSLDIRHTGLIEAIKLMAPRLFTMAGIQLIFIARDNLASRLDQVGAVTH
jgi:putative peptidoglycan lipid II flippase